MIYLISIAAFASTVLGGLFALRLKDRLHLILGFSAGAVIGVTFFDLMPEAFELTKGTFDASLMTSIMALGFSVYLILDRMIILHANHEEDAHEHSARGAVGAGALSFHSFLDGVGIGLAFQVSTQIGLIVTFAVLTHDFSDGINTVNMMLKSGGSRAKALRWLLIDAIAPLVGILAAWTVTVSQAQLGILLALFAGFFLYIGASELLPESHHRHPVRFTTFATLVGIAVLYFAVKLAGI